MEAYREALIMVAASKGVEVPLFVREGIPEGSGEEGARLHMERLRVWLGQLLFPSSGVSDGPSSSSTIAARGRSRAGRGKTGASGRALSVRGKRARAGDEGEEDESLSRGDAPLSAPLVRGGTTR